MKNKEINYQLMLGKAIDDQDEVVRGLPRTWESYDSRVVRLAFGTYKLQCFCERLIVRYESPWMEFGPLEAGRLYLLNKHHWSPQDVQELGLPDLLLLLHEELIEMKLNQEEWKPVQEWASHMSCYPALAKSAPNP